MFVFNLFSGVSSSAIRTRLHETVCLCSKLSTILLETVLHLHYQESLLPKKDLIDKSKNR